MPVFPMEEVEDLETTAVTFDYDFPLLEDIHGRGKWYELAGNFPQIVWELEIRNRGRQSIEIGELGFPLAFNNFYDGFGWTDDQLKRLWSGRVYVHKYVGGGSSWVFAQRMTAETPGLLVFPEQGLVGSSMPTYPRVSTRPTNGRESLLFMHAVRQR